MMILVMIQSNRFVIVTILLSMELCHFELDQMLNMDLLKPSSFHLHHKEEFNPFSLPPYSFVISFHHQEHWNQWMKPHWLLFFLISLFHLFIPTLLSLLILIRGEVQLLTEKYELKTVHEGEWFGGEGLLDCECGYTSVSTKECVCACVSENSRIGEDC